MAKVLRVRNLSKCIGCFTCMFICAGVNRQNHSIQKSCIKIRTYGGLAGKFVETVCHACKDPACAEACPSNALELRKGGGVVLKKSQCLGCRRCQSACIVKAVDFDEDTNKPIICNHCGVCVHYCPHGCIVIEETS